MDQLVLFFFIFIISAFSHLSLSQSPFNQSMIQFCMNYKYNCGDLQGVYFPFSGADSPQLCRHPGFELRCEDNKISLLTINKHEYRVINISQESNTIKLARNDLWQSTTCYRLKENTSLDNYFFAYDATVRNLTLIYDCPISDEVPDVFNRKRFCTVGYLQTSYFLNDTLYGLGEIEIDDCEGGIVQVQVSEETERSVFEGNKELIDGLKEGFEAKYMDFNLCVPCMSSGGYCIHNSTVPFMCSCPSEFELNKALSLCLPRPAQDKKTIKIAIGIGAGFGGILIMCVVFFFYLRHKRKQNSPSYYLSRSISSDFSSVKDIEKDKELRVPLFSYEDLVTATNNFDHSRELGDGGFGTVYYGKLKDGRKVAVKRLYENNFKRVEQFMNEVEILAGLRHGNLVTLYGCTSRHSRELLLVYEYLPNGTVADHLHGERGKTRPLSWDLRLSIAIQTADALVYLHANEIIHRDVKTNNILLDKNFTVKVADFGLSRLFPTQASHVTTAPQGTPGYVDPDYHQCYQLTNKSDVFSFGVVLMELVSSLAAVDITRHRHDINLSTMAVNRIQNHALHEMVDQHLGFENDPEVRRMVTAVAELAFQCLQHEKDMRPCMKHVLEELKAIRAGGYGNEKVVKVDNSADDAVLLNSGPLMLSPDSVTISWVSRNTTPNASH